MHVKPHYSDNNRKKKINIHRLIFNSFRRWFGFYYPDYKFIILTRVNLLFIVLYLISEEKIIVFVF